MLGNCKNCGKKERAYYEYEKDRQGRDVLVIYCQRCGERIDSFHIIREGDLLRADIEKTIEVLIT